MIQSLAFGMDSLQQFINRDHPSDPNTQIIKVIDPITGLSKLEHRQLNTNFETQSIKSDMSYKWSAVGEMNNDELDQLKIKNEQRIKQIEDRYFHANS